MSSRRKAVERLKQNVRNASSDSRKENPEKEGLILALLMGQKKKKKKKKKENVEEVARPQDVLGGS